MSQVTEQSVRFQTALPSIKLIQASAVLDLTEDDFDFLTSNKVWIATDRSRARRCVEDNIHITIIELNALHTHRQNLFQELDAVIHLLMEAKHWGLRKSRNATSLNSRFKSLDTLKVKIISVTFRRVIRTNHKKASKIWRHENIQLG